jgi:hypothetical protein
MVFLIGLIDYLTGPRIYFLGFNLIPIFQITWFAGKWAGLSISFFSNLLVQNHSSFLFRYPEGLGQERGAAGISHIQVGVLNQEVVESF